MPLTRCPMTDCPDHREYTLTEALSPAPSDCDRCSCDRGFDLYSVKMEQKKEQEES